MAITWEDDVREENAADLIQWVSFVFSIGLSAFFLREIKYGICGWEVAYIAVVETIKYIVELGWEEESPATIYLTNGNIVPWIRYVEWLSTCPVILIALSRVGTLDAAYSKSTMKLLTSDQGTIIMGIMASSTSGVTNLGFFLLGCFYGFSTFYTAAGVYLEAYRNVPEDCRGIIKSMGYSFYSGWIMFPILFLIGPEGAGHITHNGSTIGHAIADLLSKNLWGVFEWKLDNSLHAHSLALEAEEIEVDEKGDPIIKEADIVGRYLILDTAGTVSAFFSEEFKKVGAVATTASNLDTVVDLLLQVDEDTDDPYKFLILGVSDVNGHQVAAIKDQHKVPLVVFATDAQQDDPSLDEVDDIIPTPVFGKPYDNSQILSVFIKYCKQQARDVKDVMIMQLFDEITELREKLMDGGGDGGDVGSLPPSDSRSQEPIRDSVAYSDSQDALNRASFVSRPSTLQPQMGQMNMMNQQHNQQQQYQQQQQQQPMMGQGQMGSGQPAATNQVFSFV